MVGHINLNLIRFDSDRIIGILSSLTADTCSVATRTISSPEFAQELTFDLVLSLTGPGYVVQTCQLLSAWTLGLIASRVRDKGVRDKGVMKKEGRAFSQDAKD